jgi:O-antigen/teichoic acid export membrane protein
LNIKRIVLYSGLYGSSAAFLKFLGFLVFLFVARTLAVEEYALFGLFYALQAGVATFAPAGIVEIVVGLLKHNPRLEEREHFYRIGNTVFVCMASIVVVVASLVFIIVDYSISSNFQTFIFTLMVGVAYGFAAFQAQFSRLQEQHLQALCFNFVVPLAGLLGGGLGFFLQPSVRSFFICSAIGGLSGLLILRVVGIGYYEQAEKLGDSRVIFLSLPPFLLMACMGWLSGYGNNYLISVILNAKDVALFTFLLSLSAVMLLVASSLNQVWSPRFFRISQELPFEQVEKQNRVAFRWLGIALGMAGGLLLFLYSPTLGLIGGNLAAYQSKDFELLLMIISYIFVIPWWHCHNYYIVNGKGGELLRVSLFTSLVGIVAWVMLMISFGSLGIYLGFLFQMFVRALGIVLAARKHWAVTIAWDGVAGGCLVALFCYGILKI